MESKERLVQQAEEIRFAREQLFGNVKDISRWPSEQRIEYLLWELAAQMNCLSQMLWATVHKDVPEIEYERPKGKKRSKRDFELKAPSTQKTLPQMGYEILNDSLGKQCKHCGGAIDWWKHKETGKFAPSIAGRDVPHWVICGKQQARGQANEQTENRHDSERVPGAP